jgi:DNA-binding CsgD family transcriptional regulator
MPGLELALSVVNTALTVPVYAALGAFGVYGFSKRRRIADRAAKSGFDAFLRVIAILLPLSLFERLLSIFGSYSPLSRLYFRLFPTGWGFEWILFLVVSLICQVKAGAALFRPDGGSASVAGGRAVARLVLRERFAQAGLSVRESEIAELALDGIANKVLASRLGISHATVKNHLTNAYRKLGVSSRWELLALLDAKGGSDSIG